jgi:DNA-directed RNA polymerase specialized sigma24 family protein
VLTLAESEASNLELIGQVRPSSAFEATDLDLWLYRARTIALLGRYGRASVEVGRLPSLLGREFFRSRLTSYSMRSFEDIVVFVADMERSLAKLSDFEKKLLAMNILEEYTSGEMSRLLGAPQRTIERLVQRAIDGLSHALLADGLLDGVSKWRGSCQEGKNYKNNVSRSKQGENKI